MGRKRIQPKVPRLDQPGHIVAPDAPPIDEILRRDQDATVMAGATAHATRQTIQSVV